MSGSWRKIFSRTHSASGWSGVKGSPIRELQKVPVAISPDPWLSLLEGDIAGASFSQETQSFGRAFLSAPSGQQRNHARIEKSTPTSVVTCSDCMSCNCRNKIKHRLNCMQLLPQRFVQWNSTPCSWEASIWKTCITSARSSAMVDLLVLGSFAAQLEWKRPIASGATTQISQMLSKCYPKIPNACKCMIRTSELKHIVSGCLSG